jgi:hypothetical protein
MELRHDVAAPIDPVNALRGVLRAHGLDVADFEFEEHESSLVELLGSSGAILAVRRRSTGEERLYAIGHDSAWLGAFMMDLGSGHFGAVRRHAA